MGIFGSIRIVAMLMCFVLGAALPAAAAPLAGLHYRVGTWKCTYRAGAVRFPYAATYAYDSDGQKYCGSSLLRLSAMKYTPRATRVRAVKQQLPSIPVCAERVNTAKSLIRNACPLMSKNVEAATVMLPMLGAFDR